MTWFEQNDVPDVVHHRACYLHTLNVALENACGEDGSPPSLRLDDGKPDVVTRRLWMAVYDKVSSYWIHHREKSQTHDGLSREHRQMFWHTLGRMQFVLHAHSRRLKHAHEAEFIQRRRLKVTNDSVLQFSVGQLWSALFALKVAWKTLSYSEELKNYICALAAQCGRFFWIALPDTRVFDYPRFVTHVTDVEGIDVTEGGRACLCVNEDFFVETERLYYNLFRGLEEHDALIRNAASVENAPTATSRKHVADWLRTTVKVEAVREFIERDFEEQVYDRRAIIGEVEVFVEGNSHVDPTAYNAISKLRTEVIDKTAELIARESFIDDLIDRLEGPVGNAAKPTTGPPTRKQIQTEAEADSDANELAITTAGYFLDEGFISDHIRFNSWFLVRTSPVPSSKADFPVLVQVCNSWHVAHNNKVWLCANAVDAIECWMRQLCSSSEAFDAIKHVVSQRQCFYDAHKAITAGEVCRLEDEDHRARMAEYQDDALQMPLSYNGGDDELLL
jgi:hypothetical protein